MLRFLARKAFQNIKLISSSSRSPLWSGTSTYGLVLTLFKSSWSKSNKKLRSSQASYYPNPENLATLLPRTYFKRVGAVFLSSLSQRSSIKPLKALAKFPFKPRGLLVLISYLKRSKRKYLVNSSVFEIHYRAEFMKQVLPRFWRPVTPLRDCFLNN